jgi:glycosyltransferase involved in cell wall biosynthesis
MRIVQLNTYDFSGGAAKAAYRIHHAVRQVGVDSRMLVQQKRNSDDSVICTTSGLLSKFQTRFHYFDLLPIRPYHRRQPVPWSVAWRGSNAPFQATRAKPELVHLHWISHGFVSIKALPAMGVPVVWTLHDAWPFTGGCHYPGDCVRYQESCGKCPQLGSKLENDLSRWVFGRKKKHWESLNLTVVTPSRWLAETAKISSLFKDRRIETIPYCVDLSVFKPSDGNDTREKNNLPLDRKLILTGAAHIADPRKGFHYLHSALASLAAQGLGEKAELVTFGSAPELKTRDLPLKSRHLGMINDEHSLATLYSAADVFVAPSTEDNLPNTVMEALACGTPCVAFNVGGFPDMIEHEHTGYTAKPFQTQDLANGISWVIGDDSRLEALSANAHRKAEREYSMDLIGRRYSQLYEEILQSST